MSTATQTVFSTRLQTLRKERGVTQEQLASRLGVSPQAVSKWENGSYPDGDLLPRIADFFEVSIDYLYGRAELNLPVEQRVLDELQSIPMREDNTHEQYFEKALDLVWAMQIAGWRENRYYYQRNKPDSSAAHNASCVADMEGFTHMRMNEDLQYYFLARTPPQGFAERLGDAEKFAPLFAFLGDKINLKVTMYMLSLNGGEVVKASTVAKRLNIPTERAEAALGFLCGLGGCCEKTFHERSIIDDNDKLEKVYDVNVSHAATLIMLLAAADTVIEPPVNYNIHLGNTDIGWLNRKQLPFLNNGGKTVDN